MYLASKCHLNLSHTFCKSMILNGWVGWHPDCQRYVSMCSYALCVYVCACLCMCIFGKIPLSLQPALINHNLMRSFFRPAKNNCYKQVLKMISYVTIFFYNYVQWITSAILVPNINIIVLLFLLLIIIWKHVLH